MDSAGGYRAVDTEKIKTMGDLRDVIVSIVGLLVLNGVVGAYCAYRARREAVAMIRDIIEMAEKETDAEQVP